MSAAAPGSNDWRESIAQSFRSEEVRSIAKVLASLEPGATSASKTMLAMKFEDSIFKAASDLEDYRKTIQKRLKKLQKHYAKQQQSGGGEKKVGAENDDLTREKELLLESDLRDKYGARLIYIANHVDAAVMITRQEQGDHKADILWQHANNAKQWAVHLGIELPPGDNKSYAREQKRDMAFLNKLKTYLETRVENIRSHIVKVSNKDLFLEEAMLKLDDVLLKEKVTEVFCKALSEADPDKPEFTEEQMKQLVERMNAPVPIPRRNQEGDLIRAAVARIEKVRAASQALYIYMGLPLASKTNFPGSLAKCNAVVYECMKELEGECNHLVKEVDDKDGNGKRIIQLEDAWNSPLQFPELESEEAPAMEDDPDTKRQKIEGGRGGKSPMVIRTRFLLTPGRNTFSSLLPALKMKKATLVRRGPATFVRLEFGKAFEMSIYFVPLLVTIRAMTNEPTHDRSSMVSLSGGLCWPSLYQGLCPSEKDPTESNGGISDKKDNLSVLGVTGSSPLAPIIAKKLEYASAQATYVLRRCFAVGNSCLAKSDFDVEILEAGALVRFLQIARSTYIPDWVDLDS